MKTLIITLLFSLVSSKGFALIYNSPGEMNLFKVDRSFKYIALSDKNAETLLLQIESTVNSENQAQNKTIFQDFKALRKNCTNTLWAATQDNPQNGSHPTLTKFELICAYPISSPDKPYDRPILTLSGWYHSQCDQSGQCELKDLKINKLEVQRIEVVPVVGGNSSSGGGN